jgi:HEAT repeat protein
VDAEDAFRILGPVASPAIPDLTRLAIASKGEDRVMRCSSCLASIGPESVPALAEIISNYHGKGRYYPIAVLAKFGTNAQPAVPVLARCLSDPDVQVRATATNAISKLAPEMLANAPAH